jgi:hypothetical protein
MRGIGKERVGGFAGRVGWRIERQLSVTVEKKFARADIVWRPGVVRFPFVGASLEGDRLGNVLVATFEILREKLGFDFFAIILRGVSAEIERAELAAGGLIPAAVIPWAADKEVSMRIVVGFERALNR